MEIDFFIYGGAISDLDLLLNQMLYLWDYSSGCDVSGEVREPKLTANFSALGFSLFACFACVNLYVCV